MKINQDTFKEGVLNYGPHRSIQRDRLYEWRWQQFIDVVTDKYPEYFLKFYSHQKIREYYLKQLIRVIKLRMKDKLRASLAYSDMESVNSAEFDKIMTKLTNYIKQGGNIREDLHISLTQPLPPYLHQFDQ